MQFYKYSKISVILSDEKLVSGKLGLSLERQYYVNIFLFSLWKMPMSMNHFKLMLPFVKNKNFEDTLHKDWGKK